MDVAFRRVFIAVFFLIALHTFAADSKPNLLVILADDLGRGDYSAFGTKDIHTPNIDRLFHEGMTFQNFFANSCVCSPSRAALLTGCYPDRVGVPGVIREETPDDSWGYLTRDAKLLPQLLKPAGVHSALIGKWHLGIGSPNTPTERGFDFFQGFLGDMMDGYYTHRRHGLNLMRANLEPVNPQGHATDIFTDWACNYLEWRAKTNQPFFLYLAYNAPHDPIEPPDYWLNKVRQREPDISDKRAKLVALIEHLDSGIGKVLDTLDRTGLASNTLVIFTSDNGGVLANEANNGPWRGGKQHMYEGGLRVPGAARWPGHIAPGTSTDRMTMTMDIFPTACELFGVRRPADIDGRRFLPTLLDQSTNDPARDLYFVRREGGAAYGGKTIDALRRGDWKLLQDSPYAPLELYNLRFDPQEKTNLAPQQAMVFSKLDYLLRRQIQIGGQTPWQPPRAAQVNSAFARTNAARQAIRAKLDRIHFDHITYDHVLLSEVIKDLSRRAQAVDPEKTGINFFMALEPENAPAPTVPAVDPATGLPFALPAIQTNADMTRVTVSIKPALSNASLVDVLNAIVESANARFRYSVLDNGVAFFPRAKAPAPLEIRSFHINADAFFRNLGVQMTNDARTGLVYPSADSPMPSELAIHEFFSSAGVNFDTNNPANVGKAFAYTARSSVLTVRAPPRDLDLIAIALETFGPLPPSK